jgi:hypothetical protein
LLYTPPHPRLSPLYAYSGGDAGNVEDFDEFQDYNKF